MSGVFIYSPAAAGIFFDCQPLPLAVLITKNFDLKSKFLV
jgi:hypothetical protein